MQHMGPAKTVSANSSTKGAVTPSYIENYEDPLGVRVRDSMATLCIVITGVTVLFGCVVKPDGEVSLMADLVLVKSKKMMMLMLLMKNHTSDDDEHMVSVITIFIPFQYHHADHPRHHHQHRPGG